MIIGLLDLELGRFDIWSITLLDIWLGNNRGALLHLWYDTHCKRFEGEVFFVFKWAFDWGQCD